MALLSKGLSVESPEDNRPLVLRVVPRFHVGSLWYSTQASSSKQAARNNLATITFWRKFCTVLYSERWLQILFVGTVYIVCIVGKDLSLISVIANFTTKTKKLSTSFQMPFHAFINVLDWLRCCTCTVSKTRAAVDYTPTCVEPHGSTGSVWSIAAVAIVANYIQVTSST